jgi:drug/metabolite transporter (DMT)-like permease
MKPENPAVKGYLMILGSALGYASYGLWSKLIGPDFGVFTQGWVRSLAILAILIPVALFTRQFNSIARKDIKWILAIVFFGVLVQAPLYYAYLQADLGTTTVVFYALMLIASYAVGGLVLHEKISTVKLAALGLAIVGMGVVFGLSLQFFSLLALLMAGLSGAASGGEVALTKKLPHLTSLQLIIYVGIGIVVTHVPLALLFGEVLPSLDHISAWSGMTGFTIVGVVAFWLAVEGFRYVDASIGGLIGLLEIMFAVWFGILFFGEVLTATVLAGGSLILLAATLPDIMAMGHARVARWRRAKPVSVDHPL